MTMLRTFKIGGYRIGMRADLEKVDPEKILDLIAKPAEANHKVLGGRAGIRFANLRGVGDVAIKHYMRGGIFGKLITRRYFRWGATRGELEFAFLERVRDLGVNAPQPIAFISCGAPLYKAWLLTAVIPGTISLATLSGRDEERASRLLVELVRQISVLIRSGIWHVDLHPGNVLVGEEDTLYLLDFDKAERFSGTRYELRDRYLFRWRRAVIKHRLPEVLSEIVCLGLRSYNEEQGERLT